LAVDPLEWYHIIQNFPTNDLLMVKEKKFDFTTIGSQFKMAAPNLTFVNISTSNCPSNMTLAWKPVFLVREFNKTILNLYMTNSSLANYTMIPIFANKDIQKSTMVNIFSSHCFIIMVLGCNWWLTATTTTC